MGFEITITPQNIVLAGSVLAALTAIVTFFVKLVRWADRQKQQDEDIKQLRKHHEEDISSIKLEQELMIEGILACLKGLSEQGCNGPVTKAIERYENYLNKKAHQ